MSYEQGNDGHLSIPRSSFKVQLFTRCGLVVSYEERGLGKRPCGLRWMELRGFCQQDARDVEVGEHHIRGSIEGLVVGAFESVALDRRAGQDAHLGHKVFDVFMGNIKRVVVKELILKTAVNMSGRRSFWGRQGRRADCWEHKFGERAGEDGS